MKILNGKKFSEKELEKLKKEIGKKRLKLRLCVISVGDNPSSEKFLYQKEKACKKVGIDFKLYRFPKSVSKVSLKKKISNIAALKENSAIVVQLPLPKKFDREEILNLLPPKKDADILSSKTILKKFRILPPTVQAVEDILREYNISAKKKNIVILGAGKLVGKPMADWCLKKNFNFTFLNKPSSDFSKVVKKADIIISGVGKPGLITGKMVKKGVVIVDFGVIEGDIDFKTVSKKASHITPVPGGIGPLTVSCLLKNIVKLNSK